VFRDTLNKPENVEYVQGRNVCSANWRRGKTWSGACDKQRNNT